MKIKNFALLLILSSLFPYHKSMGENIPPNMPPLNKYTSHELIQGAPTSLLDTLPFRFLPIKEQYKLVEPYHTYGDLKLQPISPFVYEFRDDENDLLMREYYPSTLGYFHYSSRKKAINRKSDSAFQLDFFDVHKNRIKTIDLEKTSPYGNHPKVVPGYPNREYYDFDEVYHHDYMTVADSFFSVIDVQSSFNGFNTVIYILIPVKNDLIIGWEETLIVYDQLGEVVNKLSFPFQIHNPLVSEDGSFLLLLSYYEGRNDSLTSAISKEFHIYDLKTGRLIYKQHELKSQQFKRLEEINSNLIRLGNLYKEGKERYEYFFDLNNRTKSYKHFEGTEHVEAFKNLNSYLELFEQYDFVQEKF